MPMYSLIQYAPPTPFQRRVSKYKNELKHISYLKGTKEMNWVSFDDLARELYKMIRNNEFYVGITMIALHEHTRRATKGGIIRKCTGVRLIDITAEPVLQTMLKYKIWWFNSMRLPHLKMPKAAWSTLEEK